MHTVDEIRKVNDAMTRHNGDRQLAANELGILPRTLTTLLHRNKSLKVIWCKARDKTVTDAEVMKGPDLKVMTQEELARIEDENEKSFDALLAKATGDSEELAVARTLSKMWGKHLNQCGNLIGGTLVERAMKLRKRIEEVETELTENDFSGEVGAMEYQSRSVFLVEAHRILISIMESINKTQVARAKVKASEQQANGHVNGRTNFGPKTAIIAQNVQVGR